jgi:N-acylneuraminate cytidylyltransferase
VSIVAFIFARGGSKGLPNKNLKILAGKPLVAWAVESALKVNRVDRVIVSTDSVEIAKVAKASGAEVPFMRPESLATDTSSEWQSWQHGLRFLNESTGSLPKVMLSVPPTAPLRSHEDIDRCLDRYLEMDFDVVVSVAEASHNPFFNMVIEQPDGRVDLVFPKASAIVRRQDAPKVFDITTVCYAARPEFVLSNNSMFEGNVGASIVPIERALDIDTLFDFQVAESLFRRLRS